MERIPLELLSKIVDYVSIATPQGRISRLSSLNRSWRTAVEQITFRRIKVVTADLPFFRGLYRDSNITRRNHLHHVSIKFELSPLADDEGCSPRKQPDRKADSVLFTSAVQQLFEILHDIENRLSCDVPMISCSFYGSFRPSDYTNDFYRHVDEDRKRVAKAKGFYGLLDVEDIPEVRGVNRFIFSSNHLLQCVNQGSAYSIAAKFPQLDTLKLGLGDVLEWKHSLRVRQRADACDGVLRFAHKKLREIQISVTHSGPRNEHSDVPRLFEGNDPFARAFWHLSSLPVLSVLHLTGPVVIPPTLFQPSPIDREVVPQFPALRELIIDFAIETSDGRWFFIRDDDKFAAAEAGLYGDPEEYDDEEFGEMPRFRSILNEETITPLLRDAAESLEHMPMLEKMKLRAVKGEGMQGIWKTLDYHFLPERDLQVLYLRSGVQGCSGDLEDFCTDYTEYSDCNRLYLKCRTWTLPVKVQEGWQKVIGRHGQLIVL